MYRIHLVPASTVRSDIRSCGITLTFCWVCQRTVSLCVVNVSLLDHFLRIFIRELLIHVFLHVALNLCTRLQLCSTAQSSRSDSSLAGSSTRSVPAVPRQSSEPAGRSSHPVGGHRLCHHVCLRMVFWSAWMMRHCILTSHLCRWCRATHGLPK